MTIEADEMKNDNRTQEQRKRETFLPFENFNKLKIRNNSVAI